MMQTVEMNMSESEPLFTVVAGVDGSGERMQ
jgi:hypothetical protein